MCLPAPSTYTNTPAVEDCPNYRIEYIGPVSKIGSEDRWMKKQESWDCRTCGKRMGIQTLVPYDPWKVNR